MSRPSPLHCDDLRWGAKTKAEAGGLPGFDHAAVLRPAAQGVINSGYLTTERHLVGDRPAAHRGDHAALGTSDPRPLGSQVLRSVSGTAKDSNHNGYLQIGVRSPKITHDDRIILFAGIVEYLNRGTEALVKGREFKDAIFDQFARVGAAFGSPKRVEIVDLLAQGERTVESIAEATGMLVANTSRHLQLLRAAGMLTSRRDGLHVVYRIADESVLVGYRALQTLAESRVGEVRQLAQAFFGPVNDTVAIGVEELLARSQAGEVVVVDVRPRLEFEAGHLPGAISMPLGELSARIGELDPDTSVVAYCRGPYCVLAAQAVAQFRAAGLQATRLAAGPPDWHAAGVAVAVGSAPTSPPRRFSAKNQRAKGKVT